MKELSRARALFRQFNIVTNSQRALPSSSSSQLLPSVYTFSAFANVLVSCGHYHEAEQLLQLMRVQLPPIKPNNVMLTTILKGYSMQGDVASCRRILMIMADQWPPVMDIRAINTFLRGCENSGSVDDGLEVYEEMNTSYGVCADTVTEKLASSLMKMGLKLQPLRDLHSKLTELDSESRGHNGNGIIIGGSGRPESGRCLFWDKGKAFIA